MRGGVRIKSRNELRKGVAARNYCWEVCPKENKFKSRMKATDRQRILDKSKLKWLKNNARIPEIQECDSSTYNSHKQTNTFNTDLGS